MLAALLLNLPTQELGGGGRYVSGGRKERKELLLDAEKIESYLSGTPKQEPLKRAVKRFKQYVEAVEETTPEEVFDLSAEIQMRLVELQQELKKTEDQRDQAIDYLFVLETFTAFLNAVQEDEEAILVLLLAE